MLELLKWMRPRVISWNISPYVTENWLPNILEIIKANKGMEQGVVKETIQFY